MSTKYILPFYVKTMLIWFTLLIFCTPNIFKQQVTGEESLSNVVHVYNGVPTNSEATYSDDGIFDLIANRVPNAIKHTPDNEASTQPNAAQTPLNKWDRRMDASVTEDAHEGRPRTSTSKAEKLSLAYSHTELNTKKEGVSIDESLTQPVKEDLTDACENASEETKENGHTSGEAVNDKEEFDFSDENEITATSAGVVETIDNEEETELEPEEALTNEEKEKYAADKEEDEDGLDNYEQELHDENVSGDEENEDDLDAKLDALLEEGLNVEYAPEEEELDDDEDDLTADEQELNEENLSGEEENEDILTDDEEEDDENALDEQENEDSLDDDEEDLDEEADEDVLTGDESAPEGEFGSLEEKTKFSAVDDTYADEEKIDRRNTDKKGKECPTDDESNSLLSSMKSARGPLLPPVALGCLPLPSTIDKNNLTAFTHARQVFLRVRFSRKPEPQLAPFLSSRFGDSALHQSHYAVTKAAVGQDMVAARHKYEKQLDAAAMMIMEHRNVIRARRNTLLEPAKQRELLTFEISREKIVREIQRDLGAQFVVAKLLSRAPGMTVDSRFTEEEQRLALRAENFLLARNGLDEYPRFTGMDSTEHKGSFHSMIEMTCADYIGDTGPFARGKVVTGPSLQEKSVPLVEMAELRSTRIVINERKLRAMLGHEWDPVTNMYEAKLSREDSLKSLEAGLNSEDRHSFGRMGVHALVKFNEKGYNYRMGPIVLDPAIVYADSHPVVVQTIKAFNCWRDVVMVERPDNSDAVKFAKALKGTQVQWRDPTIRRVPIIYPAIEGVYHGPVQRADVAEASFAWPAQYLCKAFVDGVVQYGPQQGESVEFQRYLCPPPAELQFDTTQLDEALYDLIAHLSKTDRYFVSLVMNLGPSVIKFPLHSWRVWRNPLYDLACWEKAYRNAYFWSGGNSDYAHAQALHASTKIFLGSDIQEKICRIYLFGKGVRATFSKSRREQLHIEKAQCHALVARFIKIRPHYLRREQELFEIMLPALAILLPYAAALEWAIANDCEELLTQENNLLLHFERYILPPKNSRD